MKKTLISALLLSVWLAPAASQLPRHLRTDGKAVQSVFAEAADAAKNCTVRVFNGSKMVLGTVVSKDGLVVAKNSEFSTVKPGLVRVMGPGTKIARARVVARDIPHDLIILDLGREIDPGYEWGNSKSLERGTWLVAVVADSPPRVGVRGGVLSATTRGIKKAGGVIGVILGGRDGKSFGGVQVSEVAKGGPAEKAGVKKNDVIYAIDGKEVFERAKMIEIVKSNDPGTTITVSIKRGEDKKDLKITLGYRNLVFAEMKSRNDKMSGTVSVRRTGFERIIQHEISLGKSDMGGPLFDLEGKLVGINIAKANRVEFFAIPAEDIRQVLEDKTEEIAEARGEK
jgi:serine protease Do